MLTLVSTNESAPLEERLRDQDLERLHGELGDQEFSAAYAAGRVLDAKAATILATRNADNNGRVVRLRLDRRRETVTQETE